MQQLFYKIFFFFYLCKDTQSSNIYKDFPQKLSTKFIKQRFLESRSRFIPQLGNSVNYITESTFRDNGLWLTFSTRTSNFFLFLRQTKLIRMKMHIYIFAFLFLTFLSTPIFAQKTSLDGPAIDMGIRAKTWVIQDNDDQLIVASLNPGFQGGYEDLIINRYNKDTHTLKVQKVNDDLDARFAYLRDNLVCVIKEDINKKTKSVEYSQGTFFQDIEYIKKMDFTPVYNVPLNGNVLQYYRMEFSPDKSKFAILTILRAKSRKEARHIADVAVFNTDGQLLWHQQHNANWFVNDDSPFYLNNNGTVYTADFGSRSNTYYSKEDSLHITVFNEHGVESFKESVGKHATYYCGKTLLKDNRLVVSGVACPNGQNSGQLWTYFVSEDGTFEQVISDIELPLDPDGIQYTAQEYYVEPGKFLPYVFQIQELQDGRLLLVGELIKRGPIGTDISIGGMSGFAAETAYGYWSRNLFCTFLDKDGTVSETLTYPRATVSREGLPYELTNNPASVFVHNSNIYLIYNEHKANFTSDYTQRWTFLYHNMADKCCVVLSKLTNDNTLDNKVLYTAGPFPYPQQPALTANHEYFSHLLSIDDNTVYYLIKHNDSYRIERIYW